MSFTNFMLDQLTIQGKLNDIRESVTSNALNENVTVDPSQEFIDNAALAMWDEVGPLTESALPKIEAVMANVVTTGAGFDAILAKYKQYS